MSLSRTALWSFPTPQAGSKSAFHSSSLCWAMGSRAGVVMLICAWSGRLLLLHLPCLLLPLAACVRALPLAETKIAPTEPLKCQDGAGRAGPQCCQAAVVCAVGPVPCAVAWRCGPSLSVIRARPGEAVIKSAAELSPLLARHLQPLTWASLGKALVLGKSPGLSLSVLLELHLSHSIFHSMRAEVPTLPWQEGDTETTRKSFGMSYSILAGSWCVRIDGKRKWTCPWCDAVLGETAVVSMCVCAILLNCYCLVGSFSQKLDGDSPSQSHLAQQHCSSAGF